MRKIIERVIDKNALGLAICPAKKGNYSGLEYLLKEIGLTNSKINSITNSLFDGDLSYEKLLLLLKYKMKPHEIQAVLNGLRDNTFRLSEKQILEILQKEFTEEKQIELTITMYKDKISQDIINLIGQNHISGDKMSSLLDKVHQQQISFLDLKHLTNASITTSIGNIEYRNLLNIVNNLHNIKTPKIITMILSWMEKEEEEKKLGPSVEMLRMSSLIIHADELDSKAHNSVASIIATYISIKDDNARKVIKNYILETENIWNNNIVQFPSMEENSRKKPYQRLS